MSSSTKVKVHFCVRLFLIGAMLIVSKLPDYPGICYYSVMVAMGVCVGESLTIRRECSTCAIPLRCLCYAGLVCPDYISPTCLWTIFCDFVEPPSGRSRNRNINTMVQCWKSIASKICCCQSPRSAHDVNFLVSMHIPCLQPSSPVAGMPWYPFKSMSQKFVAIYHCPAIMPKVPFFRTHA